MDINGDIMDNCGGGVGISGYMGMDNDKSLNGEKSIKWGL